MTDAILVRVGKARSLLAACRDAADAKKVADLARSAEVYARRQRLGEECVAYAREVVVDAMTLMGEMLKAAEKAPPGRPLKNGSHKEPISKPPTLAELGIGKKESSDAQVLATVKEQAPELHAEIKAGKKRVSHARVELRRQGKREELRAKAGVAENGPAEWRVVTGDARAQLGVAESPRLVFADPPYNIGVDYGEGAGADRLPDEDYLRFTSEWVAACHARLSPDGSLWVLIGDEYAAAFDTLLRDHSFHRRNWVIWYETFGVNCADKFNRTKRHLFYCVKDPRRFVFHPDAVSRPSDRQTRYNDRRAAPGGKILDDVWLDIPRLPGTAAERIPDFPTQLPVALLHRVVGCCTDPGDLVLDPFCGSGTTGVACLDLGRKFIGIEKSAAFAELARCRLRGVRRNGDVAQK